MLHIQAKPPATLYIRNFGYGISVAPTTSGANVRTIGTKRARTTVLTPYLSKNSFALATRLGLNIHDDSRLNSVLPIARPVQYPVLSPITDPRKNASRTSATFSLPAAANNPETTNSESPGKKNPTAKP